MDADGFCKPVRSAAGFASAANVFGRDYKSRPSLHWNGAKRVDAETMPGWAKSMRWKGIKPVVTLSRMPNAKGVSLFKAAMREGP